MHLVRLDINRSFARKNQHEDFFVIGAQSAAIVALYAFLFRSKGVSSSIFSWNPGENRSLVLELVSPTANGDVAKDITGDKTTEFIGLLVVLPRFCCCAELTSLRGCLGWCICCCAVDSPSLFVGTSTNSRRLLSSQPPSSLVSS